MRKISAICILALLGLFSHPATAAEPIKIAAIFAKTGIAAVQNAAYIQIIELAVEEINNQGGVLGRPVKLIVLDNKSTPIGSTLAAKEAVRLQVTAVIGSGLSSHSLAVAPILQQEGIPMITPVSTNPKVTRMGNYIFRVCFIDSFQGAAMAKFAYADLKTRTAVVLRNIDEAYCVTLGEYFISEFKRYGGKVLLDGNYRGKAVDFSDLLKNVKMLKPDAVYIPGYTRDSGLIIKQAVSMGIKATFLGGDAWAEIFKYAGTAANGSYHSAPWHPDVQFKTSIHLKNTYYQKYKKQIINTSQPLSYDATIVMVDAIRRANSLDKAKIRDALAQTTDFQGATGNITFDEYGDPLGKEVIILKLENGRRVYFKAIKP
ncbi:MAG: ABC transporter substrate-binding protein [Deltaproteobacteria bacterium]|jgi:branched-chain amino acid transport system substrate-binding protein|nr:ABC transporter substrate-binding protein [Deltaproteobacteria bacterium]